MSEGAADNAVNGGSDAAADAVVIKLHTPDGNPRDGKAIFAEERAKLKEYLYDHHIQTNSETFVSVICHRTAYRRLILSVSMLHGYPLTKLHVEAKSKTLPEKLMNRLCTLCPKQALDAHAVKEGDTHMKSQLFAVYDYFNDTVMRNRLLYAMPEVKQIRALLDKAGSTLLALKENEGFLKVKLVNGEYTLKVSFTVPDEYPVEPIQIEFGASTFPSQITHMYLTIVREAARKISLGVSQEQAFGSGEDAPITSGAKAKKDARQVRMTNNYVRGLKHDVAFLKKAADLKQVDAGYNKQLHKYDYSTATRRAARRELKKLSLKEFEAEKRREEEEVRLLEKQQLEAIGGHNDRTPGRSLKYVCAYLLEDVIQKLPTTTSPTSGRKVFPDSPDKLKQVVTEKSKLRPVRASCGCWFIYEDLDKLLTEPPFGKHCPTPSCNGARVMHKDWPSDVKTLEKSWAMKKAREREISEISDFFGLSEEFQVRDT